MAKVRVYELAKELGVESKVIMTKLGDLGEFVRSASSTVEAPVVRRLKESLGSAAPATNTAPAKKAATSARSAAPQPSAPAVTPADPTGTSPVTPAAVSTPAQVATTGRQ